MRSNVTVTSAAPTYALTALATAKEELPGTVIADSVLSRWIQEASAVVATYCGRVLASETVTETFYLRSAARALRLSRVPVTAIDSVTENTDAALGASSYQCDMPAGLLYRLNTSGYELSWTTERVTVAYTGGYALLDSLPREFEQATLILVRRRAYTHTQDPNLKRIQVDGLGEREWWVSGTSARTVPDEVRELLDPYRDIVI